MIYVNHEQITEVTAPTVEPVTLTEAKLHCRVDTDVDDDLITAMIQAAREYCEHYTNRSYVTRTYRADLPWFADEVILPGPVSSITHIKYYDTESPMTLQTLAATNYRLNHDTVYRVDGGTFPAANVRHDAVQITYVTGYLSSESPLDPPSDVPAALKAAMLLFIGDLYENRERQIVGTITSENATARHLLNTLRVYR